MAAKSARPTDDGALRARRLHALPDPRPPREDATAAREHLARIQRARILAGAVDAACEHGAAVVTVADIVDRCGVSRRTFYETFEDRDECFLAAFDDALELATSRVRAATDGQLGWIATLRVALAALMRFIDEEPKLARLLVCDSLLAGPRVQDRRAQAVDRLAAFLHEGRHESKLAADAPRMQAEGAVGGVLAILYNLLVGGSREPYAKLAPTLTAMVAMPYLGPAAAQRELGRPVEETSATPAQDESLADPFKHAGMRLTYRTVRLLSTLAEHDARGVHPSNRTLGDLAGIRDQGQISKLLARLQRFGLIENVADERAQGMPNAWVLTDGGRRLADSIRHHTEN